LYDRTVTLSETRLQLSSRYVAEKNHASDISTARSAR
jgi:hypothetical protein